MKKVLANGPMFVVLYLVFMVPTYLLPYLGSNSSFINIASSGMNPLFWSHIFAMLMLVLVTWLRGSYVSKSWIVIFPILASVFDLIPGLSLVPFVPTIMHIFAIILGVSGSVTKDE